MFDKLNAVMRILSIALLVIVCCLSCKERETSPIYTIVGTYHATVYDYTSPKSVAYPFSGHDLSVKVISVTDSTVNVEIMSIPPKTALPDDVYVPSSKLYQNILSVKRGKATKEAFYLNLEPVFGYPELLNNAILFYGGTKIAEYFYTPAETPSITRTIRLERTEL
jgi:hypothetical protein